MESEESEKGRKEPTQESRRTERCVAYLRGRGASESESEASESEELASRLPAAEEPFGLLFALA